MQIPKAQPCAAHSHLTQRRCFIQTSMSLTFLDVLYVLQVKLNRGLDFVQLDDLLIDLKLTPDVLEVPVPRYFIEDRAQVGRCGLGQQQPQRQEQQHRHF